jgi:hypothetical protein
METMISLQILWLTVIMIAVAAGVWFCYIELKKDK